MGASPIAQPAPIFSYGTSTLASNKADPSKSQSILLMLAVKFERQLVEIIMPVEIALRTLPPTKIPAKASGARFSTALQCQLPREEPQLGLKSV
jgi:hypothetical protein